MARPCVRRSTPVAAVALGALLLAGCASPRGAASTDGRLRVEASFYPLQWVASRVGGRHVAVSNLTPAGAEPHDLELGPRDVAALEGGDLVVYLSGFQPAVEAALEAADVAAFDVRPAADLGLSLDSAPNGGAGEDPVHDDVGGTDVHFWLDPVRLGAVATALTDDLARRDPPHAKSYRANLARLAADLDELDAEYRAVLGRCRARDLVTSHQAFGYLARRYGLHQVGIAGLTPDQEPSSAAVARVADFVEQHGVRTIYFETLVDPAVAEVVAEETGARTAVLDPLEGLSEASAGRSYLEVMRANLQTLQAGQPCP